MTRPDYPVDLRVDYAEPRSRLWAVLTVLWIRAVSLLPHAVVLVALAIAQAVVAFVAQFAVAARGAYPEGLYGFVVGVLRWQTRVAAFFYSLTDRYPPFSLKPDADYPVDVAVERPPSLSRLYAVFTIVVQVAAVVGGVWLLVWLASLPDVVSGSGTVHAAPDSWDVLRAAPQPSGDGALVLRMLAALPHLIVLAVLGLAVFAVWLVVQWVILFTARYPRGLFDFVVGVQRWQARVSAYGLGLVDRYPPFSFDPSLLAGGAPETGPGAPPPPPPGAWHPDPTGRHELRYWDGREWTEHVADGGVTGTDPAR